MARRASAGWARPRAEPTSAAARAAAIVRPCPRAVASSARSEAGGSSSSADPASSADAASEPSSRWLIDVRVRPGSRRRLSGRRASSRRASQPAAMTMSGHGEGAVVVGRSRKPSLAVARLGKPSHVTTGDADAHPATAPAVTAHGPGQPANRGLAHAGMS